MIKGAKILKYVLWGWNSVWHQVWRIPCHLCNLQWVWFSLDWNKNNDVKNIILAGGAYQDSWLWDVQRRFEGGSHNQGSCNYCHLTPQDDDYLRRPFAALPTTLLQRLSTTSPMAPVLTGQYCHHHHNHHHHIDQYGHQSLRSTQVIFLNIKIRIIMNMGIVLRDESC